MVKESNLEFKVGLFVLIAIVLLTFFIFSVSGSSLMSQGKSFSVVFEFASGLKKNSPVRIAGVDEGIVKDINLFFDRQDSKTKAAVELIVKREVMIPADSTVTINQLGLMGEKYVEIFPGINTKEFITEGQTIIGKNPIAQEVLTERVMEVANKLEQSIVGVNRILGDEERMEALGKTFENLDHMTGQINEIVYKLNNGKGTFGKLLSDDKFYNSFQKVAEELEIILGNMREGKGTVGKLLAEEEMYNDLKGLTADLKENPWKMFYRPKKRKERR